MKGGWNLEDVNFKGRVNVDCSVKFGNHADWRANNEGRVEFRGHGCQRAGEYQLTGETRHMC